MINIHTLQKLRGISKNNPQTTHLSNKETSTETINMEGFELDEFGLPIALKSTEDKNQDFSEQSIEENRVDIFGVPINE